VIQRISIENHKAEDFTAEYRALGAQERQPQEARLQCEYVTYLEAKGHKLSRHQIASDGTYLYTDIYDETTDDLIEVKSSTDRVTMRLALGQILDYAELIEPSPTIRTVLVPRQPTRTIIDLVWANDGYAFTASDG
jgi:hypothetical protein